MSAALPVSLNRCSTLLPWQPHSTESASTEGRGALQGNTHQHRIGHPMASCRKQHDSHKCLRKQWQSHHSHPPMHLPILITTLSWTSPALVGSTPHSIPRHTSRYTPFQRAHQRVTKAYLLRTRPTPSLKGTCTTSTRGSASNALLNDRTASAELSATEPGAYTRPCMQQQRMSSLDTIVQSPTDSLQALGDTAIH